jgi:hypothetical protein
MAEPEEMRERLATVAMGRQVMHRIRTVALVALAATLVLRVSVGQVERAGDLQEHQEQMAVP